MGGGGGGGGGDGGSSIIISSSSSSSSSSNSIKSPLIFRNNLQCCLYKNNFRVYLILIIMSEFPGIAIVDSDPTY